MMILLYLPLGLNKPINILLFCKGNFQDVHFGMKDRFYANNTQTLHQLKDNIRKVSVEIRLERCRKVKENYPNRIKACKFPNHIKFSISYLLLISTKNVFFLKCKVGNECLLLSTDCLSFHVQRFL